MSLGVTRVILRREGTDCQRQIDPGTLRARAAFCALSKLAEQPRRFWGMPGMQDRVRAIFYPKGQSNNQKAFIPTLPEDTAQTRRLKNKTKKKPRLHKL